MKGQSVVFSSGKDNWQTPLEVFDAFNNEFDFILDVAADRSNRLTDLWFGPNSPIGPDGDDALTIPDWSVRNWCNPPYSRVSEFVAKAYEQMLKGNLTVMLIPSRTDTRWFHHYIWDRERNQPQEGREVRFLKGRLKFINPMGSLGLQPNSAPFPSMVVVFGTWRKR